MTTTRFPTTALDCFTAANEAFSRGYYLNAQALYDRAYALEPSNALYVAGRERLRILTFGFGKKSGGGFSTFDAANCAEGCCECCGEGCCEGICEGICSNCDGCDCDCG